MLSFEFNCPHCDTVMPVTPETSELTCPECLLHIIFDDEEDILSKAAAEDTVDIYEKDSTATGIIDLSEEDKKTITVSFSLSELNDEEKKKEPRERKRTDSSTILKPVVAKAKKLASIKLSETTAPKNNVTTTDSESLKKQIVQAIPVDSTAIKKAVDLNADTKVDLPPKDLTVKPPQHRISEPPNSNISAETKDTEQNMSNEENATALDAPQKNTKPKPTIKAGAKPRPKTAAKKSNTKTQRRLTKEQRAALDEQVRLQSKALKKKILLVNVVLISALLIYIFTR